MNSSLPLLFSFEILKISYVSQLDTNEHILLEQPAPNTYKVVKNGFNLRNLFRLFSQLDLIPICYSNKQAKNCMNVLKAIDSNLKWTYIVIDKANSKYVQANHAQLVISQNESLIKYGQGFSSCEGKQELRIAIGSALNITVDESKRKFILYEDNTQQAAKLKQNGYLHIFSQIPKLEQINNIKLQIQAIIQQKNEPQALQNRFVQFIKDTPSLQDQNFVEQIKNFHYFENKKNITVAVSLGANSASLIFRLPNSFSISAFVFKFLRDKQIYIGKADMPSDIGGDLQHQIQQNKILLSSVYQTLIHCLLDKQRYCDFVCIPTYLSHLNMRHCIVKAYNKGKGYFLIRPYIKGVKSLSEQTTKPEALKIIKEAQFKGQPVRGLGKAIAISLITNQKYRLKGLFDTVCLYKDSKQPVFKCCKIDFQKCFENQQSQQKQQKQIRLQACPQIKIDIKQIHPSFLNQIKQTIDQILQFFTLIQSTFSHYIWTFKKQKQMQIFKNCLVKYYNIFQQGQSQSQNLQAILQQRRVGKINARMLNYAVSSSFSEKFQYFTRKEPTQYSYQFDKRNVYEQKLSGTENFIVYGSCVPVLSLIRWVKSVLNCQIVYLSLLHSKPQVYTKHVKLAMTEKKDLFFIVDHCEIPQSGQELEQGKTIADQVWGFRTIFIYRLKLGVCKKLGVIFDSLTFNSSNSPKQQQVRLINSDEQIFKTIFKIMKQQNSQLNLFECYWQAINTYIQNKWLNYGVKAGIANMGIIKDRLKTIVKLISLKNNRIVSLLKQPQFNNFPLQAHTENMMNQSLGNEFQHLKLVPKGQLVLYCLPIFICSQRVELIHDIHEYLSAYYLYQQIMDGTWNGKFYGEQLKHFLSWWPHIKDKQIIKSKLLTYLDQFARQKSKKNNQNKIMGAGDSFEDCLQFLWKVEAFQSFSKLQKIFYLDGKLVLMRSIDKSNNSFVIVTQIGSIFTIQSTQQNDKAIWKINKIRQNANKQIEEQSNYYPIGIQLLIENKMISWLGDFNKEEQTFKMHEKKIKIKQINLSLIKSQVSQRQYLLNLCKLQQVDNTPIKKIELIECKYIVIAQLSGMIVIASINISNQNEITAEKIVFKTKYKKIQLKQSELQSMNVSWVKKQDCFKIVIASIINQLESNNRGCIRVDYLQITDGQIINHNSHKILNEYRLKTVGVNIQMPRQNLGNEGQLQKIYILAFQQITNGLLIWKLPTKQGNEQKIIGSPISKIYRVENDPVQVFKFGQSIYTGSKHKFMTRKIIPNIDI